LISDRSPTSRTAQEPTDLGWEIVGSAVVRGSAGSVSRTRRQKKCAGGSADTPLEAAMSELPTSNMPSRLMGPSAVTVSRSGFSDKMIFIRVGWQWFHSAGLWGPYGQITPCRAAISCQSKALGVPGAPIPVMSTASP